MGTTDSIGKNSRRGPNILDKPVALIRLQSGDQEIRHNCVANSVASVGPCSVVRKLVAFYFSRYQIGKISILKLWVGDEAM